MQNETLYILMRNDMQSLNPGKACAQAAHAGNAFIDIFEKNISEYNDETKMAVVKWKNHTHQGFGTTIVLGVNDAQMKNVIEELSENYIVGIVHDPTYPIRDGEVTHLIPVDTCAFVFAPNRNDYHVKMVLSKFNLY